MREWTRHSIAIVLTLIMTVGMASPQVPAPHYSLLLKGGHVIDPANRLDGVMDVSIVDGKIAAVGPNLPSQEGDKVVDVAGFYVTPGLIDIHYHVGNGGAPLNWFAPDARVHATPLGVPADLALQSGVTTIVDAGTAGAETFLQEKEEVIDRARVRVLAFLNIVANGMSGGLEQSLDQMDAKLCSDTVIKYRDVIVGVKTAHYWTKEPWDAEHTPWAAIDRAIDCAQLAKVPVMYDFLASSGKNLRRLSQPDQAWRYPHSCLRTAIPYHQSGWQDQSDPRRGAKARRDL